MNALTLGFEVGTGKRVNITPSHILVTGVTQKSGKTTTLESMIKRSGAKAVVFRTKKGEKSFLDGSIIPPYFKDRCDWQFIESIIESTMKKKLGNFDRYEIIQICNDFNVDSLFAFKEKLDEKLLKPKLNHFTKSILTNMQAYLQIVIPKMLSIKFSKNFELHDGLNIIDMEAFSQDTEVQSLVIRSVLEEILNNHKNTVVVIPEAWKFLPQSRGNPCKQVVEEFIRQGAANENYLWIDSQDMTGVDKTPLKQISEWIMGYQSERNEVKHTIEQLPIEKSLRPKPDEIMSLGKGKFFLATLEKTAKVYVQPHWVSDELAIKIAMGELPVSAAGQPPIGIQKKFQPEPPAEFGVPKEKTKDEDSFNEELAKLSENFYKLSDDFFEHTKRCNMMKREVIANDLGGKVQINQEEIIAKVLERIPKPSGNNIMYQVTAPEKLQKDWQEQTKNKIISDIGRLDPAAKKLLKYLESTKASWSYTQLIEKCFLTSKNGNSFNQTKKAASDLISLNMAMLNNKSGLKGTLIERLTEMLSTHKATREEIEQIYNYIIFEILGDKT